MTGYGSADVPAQIAPNTTLDLRLAVTAADATADTYEIPIEAGGAYVAARFHVHLPKLNLAFRVTSEDPNTLAKTVEIQNRGDTVTDLAVRAAPANQQDLDLQPAANHVLLDAGSAMSFTVTPILYLEFQLLKAEIEASAAGQTARFPVEFKAPPGKDLIGVRSASTTSSSASDWYCTNKPNTCSNIPGPHGTGPAPSASGEIGSVATVDSNMGIRIAEATKNYDKFPYPPTEKDGDDGIHLDCSGLVARSFMDNGLPDPRDTPGEGHGCEKMWQSLPRVDRPRKGDVVFFDIKHKLDKDGVKIPDHCGIVIGVTADGKVTIRNATVSKGVRENSLEDRWYGKPLGDYVMGYGRPLSLPVPNTCPLRHPKLSGCDFGPDFPKIIR